MSSAPSDDRPADRSGDVEAASGTLYVCATPIGNLEDVTLRVLRVLREVELIAAEDTRVTRKLLSHYDIHTPMSSYRAHGERERASKLVDRLRSGSSVALVSDAGTPLLSDPGFELVRLAIDAGIRVEALPGASACLAAAVASGLPAGRFTFEGFLPVKGRERRRRVESWRREGRTVIFYEAPHRLERTLEQLSAWLGDVRVSVGRELTKRHEEWVRGSAEEAAAHVARHGPRGEYVLVVECAGAGTLDCMGRDAVDRAEDVPLGATASAPASEGARGEADKAGEAVNEERLREDVRRKMRAGMPKKEAIREVARETGMPKRRVYAAATEIAGDTRSGPGAEPPRN